MLKGHIQIDLHNHKSGSKERIEQDNIITNAAQIMANAIVGRGKNVNNCLPLATTLLGGVMIFKDAITANVNNVCFPGNNILVGFAGQILNTEDHQLGSLNVNESGPTEDGYETVWEFTTTQANGYISSLALTNSKIVNSLPHIAIVEDVSGVANTSYTGLYRDVSTGLMTYNSGTNRCTKRIPTGSYLLDDTYNYTGSETIIGSATTINDYTYDGMNGFRYTVGVTASSGNSHIVKNITVREITVSSRIFDVESSEVYNADSISVFNDRGTRRVAVSGKITYLVMTNATGDTGSVTVIICDLSNYEYNVVTIEDEDINATINSDPLVCPLKGGGALLVLKRVSNASSRICIQVTSSGDYKVYTRVTGSDTGIYPTSMYDDLTFARAGTTLSLFGGYLGSIANLESPFEKVNTVSMKVKYELTQV